MPKWRATLRWTAYTDVVVEADTEDEAMEQAEAMSDPAAVEVDDCEVESCDLITETAQ